ncbi:hypothetical protein [Natrarchaeobaculum aegyptiacum]|uniref:Uncharacterized protein n=1 Tax=Natrarchaeobaculum aegyptiacum TaxID=745377 RepID=A0A2Z2HY41_9EURY|nr:hypothetical protein [Natrarchaeobaculum aegyptiacum]ARS91235.1 hypothetical protein B1756_16870 [Natrarchaeobaculum aegyptiacum]
MKRAFAITLTVAMIGALAFMGLAGTAAAQTTQDADSNMVQVQEGDQVNVNQPEAEINQGQAAGVGLASAEATGGDWTFEVNVAGEEGEIGALNDGNTNGDTGAFSAGDATATAIGVGFAEDVEQTQTAEIDQSNVQNNIAVQDGTSTATNVIG